MFYRDGINVTGIDRIIARAGVAKASLYNNFEGKDELVAAYLRSSLTRFDELLAALGAINDPVERLDAFFANLEATAATATFRGCPFSNAAVEIARDAPAHAEIVAFYEHLGLFFANALGTAGDDEAVRQLIVCYDGAMSAAKILEDPEIVAAARHLAVALARARASRRQLSDDAPGT